MATLTIRGPGESHAGPRTPKRSAGASFALYLGKRLLYGVIVLWGAFTASFFLLYILPGDAAGGLTFGAEGEDIEALLAEQRSLLGLDRPVLVQYFDALWGAIRGDFGDSIYQRRPATELYFESFGHTLELAATGLLLAVVIGVGIAVLIELVDWKWARELLLSLPAIAVAVPPFWIGLLLLQLFAFKLGIISSTGNDSFAGLLVASLGLAIPGAGAIGQLLTANLRGALTSPYIETVRNWGLGRRAVVLRHALRNSLLPVVTSFGTTVGLMFGGTVLTETVFSRLGVGRVIVDAVDGRDTPVVLVCVTVSAAIFVVVNFVVDALYPLIDTRIALEER
ncbi:ABC transporter permease [Leucobacter chromiiresistens]|uniref:Peptide/nickel transport system permease protein n=1 Tax=Leucobacter chromiiresistens TaxID=1079994 RepID=A0A1H1A184_9MICO|nr:ABC transporter permease [Leucobacter chromiiresistens]SDQ33393.1 peptide/nickel transport system permease protein [Leucobacter chromiiresistens]